MKFVKHILLAAMVLLAATACERRDLTDAYKSKATVNLDVDWKEFNAPNPDGITVLFYPKDGGKPTVVHSDDIENVSVTLPSGEYDVLVYNEDKDHFDCYDIEEEPQFSVIINDEKSDELLPIGVATTTVVVPEVGIYLEETPDIIVNVPTIYPHNILWTCNVNVKVGGYKYVEDVAGKFSGLAASYGKESASTTATLNKWKGHSKEKTFTTTFPCFGLHPSYSAQPDDNHLQLDFSLTNSEKAEQCTLPIGDKIVIDSLSNTLTVNISTVVPGIKGGYEVEVEPWENEHRVSRAYDSTVDDIYVDGFLISADWCGSKLYENASAKFSNTCFETTPQFFWPDVEAEAPCLFHAVSYPDILKKQDEVLHSDGDKISFDYVTANNAANQEDVLVSSLSVTTAPDNGILRLPFSHALTKVNFTIYVEDKEDNEGYVWKVSSLSVKAKTHGTYTYDAQMPWYATGELEDIEYMSGMQDLENGESRALHNNAMLIPQNGEDVEVTLTWCVYAKQDGELIKMSKEDAKRSYTISTGQWRPNANLRYTNLRLPNIGEKSSDTEPGFDDNNMDAIEYNPEYPATNF